MTKSYSAAPLPHPLPAFDPDGERVGPAATSRVEPSVTYKQVRAWGPCYSPEKLRGLADGRKRITAREILTLDIPATDRLWATLRKELVPAPLLHEFACRCAESALNCERQRGREPDPRSWHAIEVKRAWLRGEATDDDLAAARAAAEYAAEYAAEDAAWAAARDAAWAAARDAAWAAARDAAWAAQVEILSSLLDDHYGART